MDNFLNIATTNYFLILLHYFLNTETPKLCVDKIHISVAQDSWCNENAIGESVARKNSINV